MRPYEQVRVDICSHNLDVTLIGVGGGMAYGTLGNTHYGIEDINIMRWLPNMQIFCPVDKIEMIAWLDYLEKHPGPTYIRLNRGGEPNILESIEVGDISKGVPIIQNGNDIVLFSTWRIWVTAKEVAEKLSNDGHKVSLISIPLVKPLDAKTILSYIRQSKAVFTIEEHTIYGWLWSAVAEIIAESNLSIRFKRIGIQDQFFYTAGDQEYMRQVAGIGADSIYTTITHAL